MHTECLNILAKVITEDGNVDAINKDILYGVMRELTFKHAARLGIYYGDITGNSHYWDIKCGEEVNLSSTSDIALLPF